MLAFCSIFSIQAQNNPVFRDSKASLQTRTNDLLKQLIVEEKVSLLGYNSPAIPRLNIPAYNWWNEALHGVARAGEATIFPQAIGMAASFNAPLVNQIGDVISTEARAKFNLALQQNRRIQYMGLTFWSPNINIFRDPRWGRGQETYGEDPFLTSRIGTAFVKGLQGTDPHYLKTSACAKHYAVHSGPEAGRHFFNAVVDEKDLRETYLYAFKALVDANVESVMCAYNRVNSEPCCTSNTLLNRILTKEWHFNGHLVTDCGALDDIYTRHKVLPNAVEVAAAAIKAGVNLDCSNILQKDAIQALKEGKITLADIDSALAPSLRTQFKLGFYDNPAEVPFSKLGAESIHTTKHVAMARQMAQQSMVLLKNDKGILPLKPAQYSSIMILGPNAASLDALVANYHGVSSNSVTFVEGITEAAGPGVGIQYDQGCDYTDTTRFGGLWAASLSDLSIAVLGLTPVLEGEEGDAFLAASGGDRVSMSLPASHVAFLKALRKRHDKPIVAVITAGSAVDIAAIEPYADAIVLAWYPGEQGGNALADILFGKVSPSGHLPVTFYKSLSDLTAYDSYAMKGKTYRYFNGPVHYPFGFGMSYTTFAYSWKTAPKATYTAKDTLSFTVTVKNAGTINADEVVQAYIQYPSVDRMPLRELKAFQRVSVLANGETEVSFRVPVRELQKWDLGKSQWKVYSGQYTLVLGSDSQDKKLQTTLKVR